MRWFGGGEGVETKPAGRTSTGRRTSRRSTGFAAVTHALADYEQLSVLDLGPTSAANITFLTGFGGRVYNVDVLRVSQEREYVLRQEDGTETLDSKKFFFENLDYPERQFDGSLCW